MGGAVISRDMSANEIQYDIVKSLGPKKNEMSGCDYPSVLDSICLKFDKLHSVLSTTKKSFSQYAQNGYISKRNLVDAMRRMHSDVSPQHINAIFNVSDVDTNRSMDFKEFVTALTIAMTIHDLPDTLNGSVEDEEKYGELKEMLNSVATVYLLFDKNLEGYITKDSFITTASDFKAKCSEHSLSGMILNENSWENMVK
jgi:Ca2+-binding EF-hand superfamily protein